MDSDYTKIHDVILSFSFNQNKLSTLDIEADPTDKRMQTIKALVKTESTYLTKMVKMMNEVFILFDNEFQNNIMNHIASKEEVAYLFYNIPTIYNLHAALNEGLKEEMNASKMIGRVFFEFLCQAELLKVYENYVEKISENLSICKIIETKNNKKHAILMDLESMIMGPIQRFPQLSMAINDVYKNTSQDHEDKVNLFKAMLLTKSITAKLDRQRRNYEYKDFKDLAKTLKELSLPFSSTKLLSTHSVFKIKTTIRSTEEVVKTSYYLMLCDKNIILLPKNYQLSELSTDVTFSYSLDEIDLEEQVLTRFNNCGQCYEDYEVISDTKDPIVCHDDFMDFQNLYTALKGSNIEDKMIEKYGALLHDYSILMNVIKNLRDLNYSYKKIDLLSIDMSLLDLEKQLKDKERELNRQFSSFVTLKDKNSGLSSDKSIILFDSSRIADEWRINFNRTKLLSSIQMEIDWLYYPAGKTFYEMNINELPLVFQPFPLKKNPIVNIESGTLKYQIVNVAVGSKICSCLWICLPKGKIIILHFDYKQWRVLESFVMATSESITNTCSFNQQDSQTKKMIDSEIWMSSGNNVFIYSLMNNKNSELKEKLQFSSEINALCNFENIIFVGLKSKLIIVYSKKLNSQLLKENEISLKKSLTSKEEIQNILCDKEMMYTICGKKIIIFEKKENGFLLKDIFSSDKKVKALSITLEGVWVSFEGSVNIIFYDRLLNKLIHKISFPTSIFSLPSIGNITSIYASGKSIWLGTQNGLIIYISTIDSSYCTDSDIPMYISFNFGTGPITHLIPFQNIESAASDPILQESHDKQRRIRLEELSSVDEYIKESNSNKTTVTSEDFSFDEVDALTDHSLRDVYKNWKNSALTLILGFGTGIAKYTNKTYENEITTELQTSFEGQPTIFTFFE